MKLAVVILFANLLLSCATIHPGKKASVINNKDNLQLDISARVIADFSDDYHQYIDITFENKSNRWEKIKEMEVVYGDGEIDHNLILGKDLQTWIDATNEKRKMEQHNNSVLLGSMLALSAVAVGVSSKSNNNTNQALAGAAVLGTLAVSTQQGIESLGEDIRNAESSDFDKKFTLTDQFSVPPELFVRKWILVYSPGDSWAKNLYLKITTVDGKKSTYKVVIN